MNTLLFLAVAMFVVFALIGTVILCLPTKILGDLQNWVLGKGKDRGEVPRDIRTTANPKSVDD